MIPERHVLAEWPISYQGHEEQKRLMKAALKAGRPHTALSAWIGLDDSPRISTAKAYRIKPSRKEPGRHDVKARLRRPA